MEQYEIGNVLTTENAEITKKPISVLFAFSVVKENAQLKTRAIHRGESPALLFLNLLEPYRSRYLSVTAPSEAEATSLAYFASTPFL